MARKRIQWTPYMTGGGAAGRVGSCTLEVSQRRHGSGFVWWAGGVMGTAPTAAKAKREAAAAVHWVSARGGCA